MADLKHDAGMRAMDIVSYIFYALIAVGVWDALAGGTFLALIQAI